MITKLSTDLQSTQDLKACEEAVHSVTCVPVAPALQGMGQEAPEGLLAR